MTDIPPFQQTPRVFWRLPARMPIVTLGMIVLCVVVYLLQALFYYGLGGDLPAALGAKVNELIMRGQVWRLFTPMFLHGSFMHIGFNMYALYVIGIELERFYGNARYALLILISGFAGNVFSFLFTDAASVGASTAIFGLIAAEGVFFFQNRHLFRNAGRIIFNTGLIIVINLVLGLSPGIDNWGHLGGLLGGFMFAVFAGPIWQPDLRMDGLHITNRVNTSRVLLVALLVGGMFAFFALAKIFGLLS